MAFRRRTIQETAWNNGKVNHGGEMNKSLTAMSFAALGVGTIIASGIFSFLPYVYVYVAGPAVMVALLLSAGTAALSAMCYSGALEGGTHPCIP